MSQKLTATASSLSTGGVASARKRSPSPRPLFSSSSAGVSTPQRANMSTDKTRPYVKETRNLNDNDSVFQMMKNIAAFLNDFGFPEFVTPNDIQKIDKQSFVNYFNFIFQFLDSNYKLGPRFDEEELIKTVRDHGYCGTLAKSALVFIGMLHCTSQVVGLLSWLSDLVRILTAQPDDQKKTESKIKMRSYNAWCNNESFDLVGEFRSFYKEKHQIDDGRAEMLDRQIQAITEEYKTIEKKSYPIEKLKAEIKHEEQKLEEISAKEVQLEQRFKELQNKKKHVLHRLEEIKEKTTITQIETAELVAVAKNCKISADEARRIKSAIATNRKDYAAASEQCEQVAQLVEKREMQLANIEAEVKKFDRKLAVDLLDMGMAIAPDMDFKEAVKNFLDCKTAELDDIESRSIAMNEKKERTLAEISHLRMKLKHSELLECRLDDRLESVKAERDEMQRHYLSQLAELESLFPVRRSDPREICKQFELETLRRKFAEQQVLKKKQEKEIQETMARNAQVLKDAEAQYQLKFEKDVLKD